MTTFENRIKDDYFEWLYNYICKDGSHDNNSYEKLFMFLHHTEFVYLIQNDINRAKDGVNLRYRFATEMDDMSILDILDGPCSVLEMMVALAVRCEETIMDDPKYGDRTATWFWHMLHNLGISYMYNDRFDLDEAEEIIYTFLDRCYSPDGQGGLFYIRGCKEDLRNVEIWIQLCWYLNELFT
ncbi:MAG: hypothetical protein IKL08_05860 [Clostridia bacterium]|nr:hypothetical protein [Clostridia bacterium]